LADSTVEPEAALERDFERSADSTVETEVDFEVLPDKVPESITLVCRFIETTAEMSEEFCSFKFRKSFLVTSLPSGVMKFIVNLLYAASAVDCAVDVKMDCETFLESSAERLAAPTVDKETALED